MVFPYMGVILHWMMSGTFQETIRRMVNERLVLKANEVDASSEFSHESYALFREYGLPGINIPEEDGGVGADAFTCAIVIEEIAKTRVQFGKAIIKFQESCLL